MNPLADHDILYGCLAAMAGTCGLVIQAVTDFASMTAAVLNVMLALGGLYLLYRRIRKSHKEG